MRPQKIEALGFGHDAVFKRNPRIIYAGLAHGYLNGGPYSGQPAYDDVIQGQSGIAALMEQVTGEPRYIPLIIPDKTCALAASGAILLHCLHENAPVVVNSSKSQCSRR